MLEAYTTLASWPPEHHASDWAPRSPPRPSKRQHCVAPAPRAARPRPSWCDCCDGVHSQCSGVGYLGSPLMIQICPYGSLTRPSRLPYGRFSMGMTSSAPCCTMRSAVESGSDEVRRSSTGDPPTVVGALHPHSLTLEPTQLPIHPGRVRRAQPCRCRRQTEPSGWRQVFWCRSRLPGRHRRRRAWDTDH
jgi:hypothetical protein